SPGRAVGRSRIVARANLVGRLGTSQANGRLRFGFGSSWSYDGPMQAERDDEPALDKLRLRYQRVQESLEAEIARGGRAPGSRLPPERALAEHFGVSRVTLRRALAELERTGVVTRADTRGWPVAGRRIGEAPHGVIGVTELAA